MCTIQGFPLNDTGLRQLEVQLFKERLKSKKSLDFDEEMVCYINSCTLCISLIYKVLNHITLVIWICTNRQKEINI